MTKTWPNRNYINMIPAVLLTMNPVTGTYLFYDRCGLTSWAIPWWQACQPKQWLNFLCFQEALWHHTKLPSQAVTSKVSTFTLYPGLNNSSCSVTQWHFSCAWGNHRLSLRRGPWSCFIRTLPLKAVHSQLLFRCTQRVETAPCGLQSILSTPSLLLSF